MERTEHEDLCIRLPVNMIQYTEMDGKVWPLEFDYDDPHTDENVHVKITRVKTYLSMAEAKHGAVGDRFECDIDGIIDYVWYSKVQPRQWFILIPATKEEYEAYYALPGESG